jgi:hypothetical protein
MLTKCYATMVRFFFFFLFDTDQVTVPPCDPLLMVSTVLHAVPLCAIVLDSYNPAPPSHFVIYM